MEVCDNETLNELSTTDHVTLPPGFDLDLIEDIDDYINFRRTISLVFLLVLFVAVIGNVLVLILFVRSPHLRTLPNSFLMSLTLADLLTALVGLGKFILYT